VNIFKATSAVCSIRCGLNCLMSLMFRGLCLSVSVLNTLVSAAELAEPIEDPVERCGLVGLKDLCTLQNGGCGSSHGKGGSFGGVDGQHTQHSQFCKEAAVVLPLASSSSHLFHMVFLFLPHDSLYARAFYAVVIICCLSQLGMCLKLLFY